MNFIIELLAWLSEAIARLVAAEFDIVLIDSVDDYRVEVAVYSPPTAETRCLERLVHADYGIFHCVRQYQRVALPVSDRNAVRPGLRTNRIRDV